MSTIISKKTYQEINDFKRIAMARLATSDLKKESKLNACIFDLLGNPASLDLGTFYHLTAQYASEQNKIRRKYAATDKKGYILRDSQNNYVYTKESEEKCQEELEQLVNNVIEFTPSYCPKKDLPKNLLPAELATYKGFVIE